MTGQQLSPLEASRTTSPAEETNITAPENTLEAGERKLTESHLHQVPAVNMTVLRAAQDMSVFTGQAAIQLIAFHLVSCISTGNTHK